MNEKRISGLRWLGALLSARLDPIREFYKRIETEPDATLIGFGSHARERSRPDLRLVTATPRPRTVKTGVKSASKVPRHLFPRFKRAVSILVQPHPKRHLAHHRLIPPAVGEALEVACIQERLGLF